ncbi:TatD family hydrolase [Desulfurispira natronophila]|uniref:TatD DNase family protein n=1 Tax=Desulfurispira natronophila TaxID=682562 RepID=A0A7W7Y5I0_9BACT|nr:TatD family hydrolase [Desulfurispira natronophila]MBB5022182.1 TatD DNase family protein [Desulfurispira natronophila]
MPRYIDIHTHLALKDYDYGESLEQRLQAAREQGVARCITIGTDDEDNQTNSHICQQHDDIFMAVGIHPSESTDAGRVRQSLEHMAPLLKSPKTIAVGETGLDYYWTRDHVEAQRDAFHQHLKLAQVHDLPVMVHSREAFDDTCAILAQHQCRGVIHCFTGSVAEARAFLDMGYLISLPGIVTFPKAKQMHEVAKFLPAEHLLCETDSPYLSPVPRRGRENQSAHIPHIYAAIAELRGQQVEELAGQIWDNAEKLFRFEAVRSC